MNPNVRRDLVIGGAVVAFGLGLLGFALFGTDESFRAPRWAVAAAAVGFMVGGFVPLRHALSTSGFVLRGTWANLAASVLLFIGFALAAWVLLAVGFPRAADAFHGGKRHCSHRTAYKRNRPARVPTPARDTDDSLSAKD